VERAVALGNGQIIDLGDLPPSIAASPAVMDAGSRLPDAGLADETGSAMGADLAGERRAASPSVPPSTTDLEDIERATIQRVFEQVKGDKTLAGRMLGISRATLYRKLKRYNISGGTSGSSSQTLQ